MNPHFYKFHRAALLNGKLLHYAIKKIEIIP